MSSLVMSSMVGVWWCARVLVVGDGVGVTIGCESIELVSSEDRIESSSLVS